MITSIRKAIKRRIVRAWLSHSWGYSIRSHRWDLTPGTTRLKLSGKGCFFSACTLNYKLYCNDKSTKQTSCSHCIMTSPQLPTHSRTFRERLSWPEQQQQPKKHLGYLLVGKCNHETVLHFWKKKRKTLQKTKWKIAQGHGDQNEQRSINASSLPKTVSILRIFQFCFKIPSAFLSQVSTALGKIPWWCSFVENEKEKKNKKQVHSWLARLH